MTTIILEGKEYQLDIEQAKELGLLKEKDNRVKSWKEFIEKYQNEYGYFYAANENKVVQAVFPIPVADQLTPHEAKALAAFSKLIKLRRDWIGEWEPNWGKRSEKFILYRSENSVCTCSTLTTAGGFSFPTNEMASEFLATFHDLIEDAKILI